MGLTHTKNIEITFTQITYNKNKKRKTYHFLKNFFFSLEYWFMKIWLHLQSLSFSFKFDFERLHWILRLFCITFAITLLK